MAGPIDMGTAAVLGAVQGATELLPVSSSGHVALGTMLFGSSEDTPLALVVLPRFGTLIATIALFRRDLVELGASAAAGIRRPNAWLAEDDGKLVAGIVVASVSTAVIGLFLEDRGESFSRIPWVVGAGLLASAAAVSSTRRSGGEREALPLSTALLVGIAQGCAVTPGRQPERLHERGGDAPRDDRPRRLPVLVPPVAARGGRRGAALAAAHRRDPRARAGAIIGGFTALVVGYAALKRLRSLVTRGRFWTFALYLVPLGAGLVLWQVRKQM